MAHEREKPWWLYVHEKGQCPNPSPYMEKVHGAAGPGRGEG
jgi:hypothetical protein